MVWNEILKNIYHYQLHFICFVNSQIIINFIIFFIIFYIIIMNMFINFHPDTGDWKDNWKTGKGLMTVHHFYYYYYVFYYLSFWICLLTSIRYAGDWKDNRKTGKGLMTFTDKVYYEGGFADDLVCYYVVYFLFIILSYYSLYSIIYYKNHTHTLSHVHTHAHRYFHVYLIKLASWWWNAYRWYGRWKFCEI
jgi:hypothetical protein